jgi:hypothetical protein
MKERNISFWINKTKDSHEIVFRDNTSKSWSTFTISLDWGSFNGDAIQLAKETGNYHETNHIRLCWDARINCGSASILPNNN